ncbi:Lysozyme RrrD [compost metagenome]|uniref:Lysozyme n=1 Tax=Serratia liquefaciens TaxID=614 RepID=A0ABX7DBM3_SERLI|nr:lysozyme [Serratia liquefaciens]QQU58037.1 lysozyme [Serratia liquefaciens]
MNISDKGLKLIQSFEGFREKAYLCPAGVWTIGYGHTKNVYPGQVSSMHDATMRLQWDAGNAERVVRQNVNVQLSQNQFDALVSFVFNLGERNFVQSTLLKYLNAGDYASAANQLLRWNKADGRVLPGLTRRRRAEKELFETSEPAPDCEMLQK